MPLEFPPTLTLTLTPTLILTPTPYAWVDGGIGLHAALDRAAAW